MPKTTKPKKSLLEFEISLKGVSLTDKALFAKHLSVMLEAGLVISEALSIIADSVKGRFKKIIRGVLQSVEAGHSLSSSFARYPKEFSGIFVSATYAGEASGTLDENFRNIAAQLEKEKELSGKIKGALLYPAVVLSATFFLGMAMSFLVLPKITPLFRGLKMELPITTRALLWFSSFMESYGLIFVVGVVGFVFFMLWLVKQKFSRPIVDSIVLHLPFVKEISHKTNLARFCRNLGTLLRSGLNIDEALEVTKDTLGNFYYSRAIGKVSQSISKGTKLSDNLREFDNLFPTMVTRMIMVGEKSGKLEDTLFYLADFYEAEVDNATKSLSTAIEPLLLIVIGFVVGFLALSIITPIYNVTGNINR